jgi:hypothetical protein
MDPLKSLIILGCMLLYWKFIYYPFHKKDYTPISFFVLGGGLFFYGCYGFIQGVSNFHNIKFVYIIMVIFLACSFSLLLIAIKKHGLKTDIDITLTWAKKTFPFLPFWFWMIISFPAIFFVQLATFDLIGAEHIAIWVMVFIAWVFSNFRLTRNYILR